MKSRWILMAVLGLFALAQCALAAPMVVNFSAAGSGVVSFIDVSGGVNFTFPPNLVTDTDFSVNSISGFTGLNVLTGLGGVITGTYNYLTGAIVTSGPVQTAPVTGTGTFVIHDGASHDLTSTLTWIDIATVGTGGAINTLGTVNLGPFSYTGGNAQLLQLAANPLGIVGATFQFVSPAMSLTALAAGCSSSPCSTSFSGSLTAVPEPGFYGSLALGGAGLIFLRARRR